MVMNSLVTKLGIWTAVLVGITAVSADRPKPEPKQAEPLKTEVHQFRSSADFWIATAPRVSRDAEPAPINYTSTVTDIIPVSSLTLPSAGKSVGVVIVDSPGKWIVFGSSTGSLLPVQPRIFEGGKVCIVEGAAGNYAAIKIPPGDDQPEVFTLTLGTPAPSPTPTPNPNPTPTPTPPALAGFAKLAYDQAVTIALPARSQAPSLARNFSSIGAQLAAGGFTSVDQANAALKSANQVTLSDTTIRTAWVPWFTAWKTKADAELSTNDQYVKAFADTAAGLTAVPLQ